MPPADGVQQDRVPTLRPATSLSRKFVRYLVGFGVGVGVGLAPYLGLLNVPLFRPLLDLIPDTVRDSIIPLSAAMMGLIAVAVQWYAYERASRKGMRKVFAGTLLAAVVTFALLAIVHAFVVRSIPIENGKSISFLVGFTRPLRPPCTEDVSDEACIQLKSADPAQIKSFWGDRAILVARLALTFTYLLFTGSFGILVGLIVLREKELPPAPPAQRSAARAGNRRRRQKQTDE